MRTIEKTIYKFNELSKEAQAKAIENNRYINVQDYDWNEAIIEIWIDRLNEVGFPNAKIHYDFYQGQGDVAGACFDANINPIPFLTPIESEQLKDIDLSFEIVRYTSANYYSNERTRFTTYRGNYYGNLCNLIASITERIEKARYSLSKKIYDDLRDHYNLFTSDEVVIATIEANEYEFYEDGSMY